jgi:uncharacterized protein
MIVIDANIWAYFFDSTLKEYKAVQEPLKEALSNHEAAVNAAIAVETLHYLVKRLGPLVGRRKGETFLRYELPIFPLDTKTLDITHQVLCEFTHLGIGGRDASIIASMRREGIDTIMTHDKAFKRIKEIKVIDPV